MKFFSICGFVGFFEMSQIYVVLLKREESPLKLKVNFWVALMAGARGGHAKEAMKHGGSNIRGSYKARILKFRVQTEKVSSVLVMHAYMRRTLDLDPAIELRQLNGSNCKFFPLVS